MLVSTVVELSNGARLPVEMVSYCKTSSQLETGVVVCVVLKDDPQFKSYYNFSNMIMRNPVSFIQTGDRKIHVGVQNSKVDIDLDSGNTTITFDFFVIEEKLCEELKEHGRFQSIAARVSAMNQSD